MEEGCCGKTCLDCTHFCIWNGDPTCLEETKWAIILPHSPCNLFKERKGIAKTLTLTQKYLWEKNKMVFFTRYTIREDLADEYLKLFPEDANLIRK